MAVKISNVICNILRINGEDCLIIKDESSVLSSIEYIMDKEAEKFKRENPGSKILTEIDRNKKTASIYIQKIGFVYNGSPTRITKIDVVQVPIATLE